MNNRTFNIVAGISVVVILAVIGYAISLAFQSKQGGSGSGSGNGNGSGSGNGNGSGSGNGNGSGSSGPEKVVDVPSDGTYYVNWEVNDISLTNEPSPKSQEILDKPLPPLRCEALFGCNRLPVANPYPISVKMNLTTGKYHLKWSSHQTFELTKLS